MIISVPFCITISGVVFIVMISSVLFCIMISGVLFIVMISSVVFFLCYDLQCTVFLCY